MPRKGLVHGRFALLALAPLLASAVALSACKKKDGETETPGGTGSGKSADQIRKEIEDAKSDAKVAGLVDLANKDLNSGRYLAATKLAEQALAESDDNADAYAIIGAAHWRAGDFAASTAAFERAIEIDPKNFGAALGLARNYQAVAKDKEAIELLDRVLAEDKDQLAPRMAKLWSYYALTDADGVVQETDEIFTRIPEKDPYLPLIQAYASYMRPLAGKGPFCQASGSGKTTLGVDPVNGIKFIGTVVGEEFTQAMVSEIFEETLVDAKFVKTAGLKSVGKFKPLGTDKEVDIVIIPSLKFGEMTIKNVPAYVAPLGEFEAMVGETPGLRLGRQVLRHIGTLTFDFAKYTVELSADVPSAVPTGATEVPLLMLSYHVQHAPVVPVKIKGSEHTFYAYFGGLGVSSLMISKKHYLKSGFLTRHVEPPDDVERGLKMVYLEGYEIGGDQFPGTGGLVLVNEPPAPVMQQFLENTAFEIGGFINLNLMQTWRVTYVLPQAKLYIEHG